MNGKVQPTQPFILYGTSACHLCDMAEALIKGLERGEGKFVCEKSDIALCDELFKRYSLHIPVLLHPQGHELFWPLDAAALREFYDI